MNDHHQRTWGGVGEDSPRHPANTRAHDRERNALTSMFMFMIGLRVRTRDRRGWGSLPYSPRQDPPASEPRCGQASPRAWWKMMRAMSWPSAPLRPPLAGVAGLVDNPGLAALIRSALALTARRVSNVLVLPVAAAGHERQLAGVGCG